MALDVIDSNPALLRAAQCPEFANKGFSVLGVPMTQLRVISGDTVVLISRG